MIRSAEGKFREQSTIRQKLIGFKSLTRVEPVHKNYVSIPTYFIGRSFKRQLLSGVFNANIHRGSFSIDVLSSQTSYNQMTTEKNKNY